MAYQVELEAITLKKLGKLLRTGRLLPSQQVLRDDLDERLRLLEKQGIRNIQQLQAALKTKRDVGACAKATGIPENFLVILRREANGYTPKPRALKDFPTAGRKLVSALGKMGVKDTIQYLEKAGTRKDRKQLAQATGAGVKDIEALTRLADVARLRYVSASFATLLVKGGYPSVEAVAKADPRTLHGDLVKANEGKKIFGGAVGLEDMKLCVLDAREVRRPFIAY
jgi:hypothetical protein